MDERELAFAGLARQAELIREREISPRELVEVSLSRIERLNPELNAFRRVYAERALEEAKAAGRRGRSKNLPPLHGVPIAIKDNTDVAGDVTTHGTSAYGAPAVADSEMVRRVRDAGAIVIGRTTVPPLCALCVTESATFGYTRNPWDVTRTPGGSSGGSGAAVTAGLVAAASGSDGGGSIRVPAAFCGIFGIKPQRGRISTAPLADHWYGLTSFGWLTRSVGDSALLLDVTSGSTDIDRDRPSPPDRSFSEAAASSPGRLRIAYSTKLPPGVIGVKVDDEVRSAVTETAEVLRSLGHDVVERDPDYGLYTHGVVARYMRGTANDARTLPRFELLDRRFRALTRVGGLISDSRAERAREHGEAMRRRLEPMFSEFDAVLTPVTSEPAPELGRLEGLGLARTIDAMVRIIPWPGAWNHTGQPAAAIPAGLTAAGLPRAAMLVGRTGDEGTVLSIAAQLEAERPWADRLPPVS